MRPVLPLFAPDRAIERRERQTDAYIYRPGNGDPTHRVMATNSQVSFGSWIANLTEGHLRAGNRVAKLSIWGYLHNSSFLQKTATLRNIRFTPLSTETRKRSCQATVLIEQLLFYLRHYCEST